ncbi:MAG: hypothetical protein R3F35_02805 [Myxococcota bacterium]
MFERKAGGGAGWRERDVARWLTGATGGLLVVALALMAIDAVRIHGRALASGDAELQRTARVAEALWEADASRIQALLARLRVELRTQSLWAGPTNGGGDASVGPVPTRRTDTLLRRAFEGMPELETLELVVADQRGLSSVRIEPGAGPPVEAEDAAERAARARSLWYADAVEEAVAANGRRVVRGPIGIEREGERGRALVQVVIALHDVDEVVQGVLIATIDLWPLGSRLAGLSTDPLRFALVTPDGRSIGDSPVRAARSGSAVEGDAADTTAEAAVVEVGDVRRWVQPVPGGSTEAGPRLRFWIETDRPESIVAALRTGPAALLLAALVALGGAFVAARRSGEAEAVADGQSVGARRAETVGGTARAAGTSAGRMRGAGAIGQDEALEAAHEARRVARAESVEPLASDPDESPGSVRPERFVLRDWLADVRGCLEREAASRGLSLVLRCERALPREVEQDPLWLGGLIVSLGREALDATSASRVALEVVRGDDAALRFELDAGGTELDAVEGMRQVARRLGASLESSGAGRLAVVLPGALA